MLGLLLFSAPAVASANRDPTAEEGKSVVCPVQEKWVPTSELYPGKADVQNRWKDRPVGEDGIELVDIAIDGWAPAADRRIGADGWNDANSGNFRVVFGTRIPVHQSNDVVIEFYHPDEDLTINRFSAQSPAGGATL